MLNEVEMASVGESCALGNEMRHRKQAKVSNKVVKENDERMLENKNCT